MMTAALAWLNYLSTAERCGKLHRYYYLPDLGVTFGFSISGAAAGEHRVFDLFGKCAIAFTVACGRVSSVFSAPEQTCLREEGHVFACQADGGRSNGYGPIVSCTKEKACNDSF